MIPIWQSTEVPIHLLFARSDHDFQLESGTIVASVWCINKVLFFHNPVPYLALEFMYRTLLAYGATIRIFGSDARDQAKLSCEFGPYSVVALKNHTISILLNRRKND